MNGKDAKDFGVYVSGIDLQCLVEYAQILYFYYDMYHTYAQSRYLTPCALHIRLLQR